MAHQPIRTCIACRSKRMKYELLRIVRTPAKELKIDVHQKKQGRGAYLCFNQACIRKALKKQIIQRNLGVQVPPDFEKKLLTVLNGESR